MPDPIAAAKPNYLTRFIHSPFGFAFLLSAGVVALRLFVFDYWEFFQFKSILNHDLYQGASIFCPSMHAMRLEGDIAWWNPAELSGGVAQYYNAFLGPLAPSNGHIVFILWAQFIHLLNFAGIVIPEYVQYLLVEVLLLPFLAYFFLSCLMLQMFRSRITVALIVITYALSGIGLWNSAWFYYQEPATLFFLLGSTLALLKKPSVPRLLAFTAAVLVQLASTNYWTLYNTWFIAIFLGSYALLHRWEFRRLWRLRKSLPQKPTAAVTCVAMAFIASVALWIALISSVTGEQSAAYQRATVADQAGYTEDQAFLRAAIAVDMRRYTIELFDPWLPRILQQHHVDNAIHGAQYIGACLLPLLLLFFGLRWGRREQWLTLVAAALFLVCVVPGWLLKVWYITPFMSLIQHQFYFYEQYFEFAVVLLAAASFDRVIAGVRGTLELRRLKVILNALFCVIALLLAEIAVLSPLFVSTDSHLQAIIMCAVIMVIGGACLLVMVKYPRARMLFAVVFVCVVCTDLSRYYRQGSKYDQAFTYQLRFVPMPYPLAEKTAAALKKPWVLFVDNNPFTAGLYSNMPVQNYFWPLNKFNPSRYVSELQAQPPDVQARFAADHKQALEFHAASEAADPKQLSGPGTPDFKFAMAKWNYNSSAFKILVPQSGWLAIRQLYDRNWRIRIDQTPVDFVRTNFCFMAVPVEAGEHVLTMEYWPLSRQLYWPAAWVLELTLLALTVSAKFYRRLF